jgi:hypothetical protein
LPAAFIGNLSPATLASMGDTQLAALTVAQVGAITAAQVDALAPAQVAALGVDVSGLAGASAASLDAAQVAAMADAGTLDDLSVAATGALAVNSLDNITPAHIAALSAPFVGDLAPATLASVSDAQITAFTPAQVAELTATQIDALSPAQVAAIGTDVSGLSTAAAGSLDAAQVNGLADANLLDDLSTAAIGALAVDSLDNISGAEVAALPDAFMAALAPATVASVSEAQIGAFTDSQALALTQSQLDAIDAAGLTDNFSPSAQAALSSITLTASALDGQGSVDVRTNIVLNFSGDVTAVAGKFITLVDDTTSGFHGESTTNTQTIAVDDPRVTISGSRVTINFEHDLDFSSNYHVQIDAGAFVGVANGREFAGVSDATTLNFTTVAPTNAGVASTIADASGAMVQSLVWKDLEHLDGSGLDPTTFNAAGANYGLVFVDYSPDAANIPGGYDGVHANDFNVEVSNFAAGDLLYTDNYGRNDIQNSTAATYIFEDGVDTYVLWDSEETFGGTVVVKGQRFETVVEWQSDLGLSYAPYVIA